MKNKVVIFTLVLLVLSLPAVYAGNANRTGTAGAPELLIPIGSRGTAMGGAVLTSVSGVEAVYWNPAGLATLEGTEAMFTHIPYFASIDVNFGGVATTIESFGTIAAAAKVVSVGDIEQTTISEPDGNGNIFNPTLSVLSLSYARILTANVQFGFNANFINEKVINVQATGVAFDVGFIYDPRWQGFKIGLSIKNYGPKMKFSGRDFERIYESVGQRRVSSNSQSFELPSYISMGISYDLINEGPNYAMLSGNLRSNNFSEDMWTGGAEYVYDGKYSLRAGYNYSNEDAYLYGVSFGAGVIVPLGESKVSLEYTWTQTDVFDDNQFFTLKFDF